MYNFIIKIVAKSVPAICIVGGLVIFVGALKFGLGFGAGVFGVLVFLIGVGLQVLYLYWNRR